MMQLELFSFVILALCGRAWGAPTQVAQEPAIDPKEEIVLKAVQAAENAAVEVETDAVPKADSPEGASDDVYDTEDIIQADADFIAAFAASAAAEEGEEVLVMVLPEVAPDTIDDTEDGVLVETDDFAAAFDAAAEEAGAVLDVILSEGLPKYLEDNEDVAQAKADFAAIFDIAAAAEADVVLVMVHPEGPIESVDDIEDVEYNKDGVDTEVILSEGTQDSVEDTKLIAQAKADLEVVLAAAAKEAGVAKKWTFGG